MKYLGLALDIKVLTVYCKCNMLCPQLLECFWWRYMMVIYWYLDAGVIITPLVIHASRGNTRCHHSALPAVTNNVASLRLSSESHPGMPVAQDTRSPASSSLLSRGRHHHHHHHHHHHLPTVSSSASVDNSSTADVQLSSQILIRPAYDNQLPLKHLQSSSEILPGAGLKVASIDAPLEQLSLPPPLIPVPCSQSSVPSKHASSRVQSHAPRRSLPSTPPPVPVRRSVGNVRETVTSAPPTAMPAVDSAVAETTKSGDAPSNECVVCLEHAPDSVLYTCGHMCMCYSCARDVVQNRGALCPICRQSIRDVIKIFRSWTSVQRYTYVLSRWIISPCI